MPTNDYSVIDELIKELGPEDEPGFWWLDSGNLQWFAAEAHKRLNAAVREAAAKAPTTSTKAKITEVGQACRDCQTPVVYKTHSKPPKYKGQSFYYAHWLHCPGCKKDYFLNEARVLFDVTQTSAPCLSAPQTHIGPPEAVFDAGQVGNGVAPW